MPSVDPAVEDGGLGVPVLLCAAMSSRAADFWDQKARWNALLAIYDTEGTRDPTQAQAAFDLGGESDARELLPFVHPRARVLDLGCGIGRVMRPLAPHVGEIVGVDVSGEMLSRARDYLHGVPNHRLVLTDGRSLPDIEDQSVDLLYSFLCFIHVDKRSAYRYFGEIARVLAPRARALLQFQDILSAEGLAKFAQEVDSDYPLEFYTLEELVLKLRRRGLDVLDFDRSKEYLYLQVVRGTAEDWRASWRDGVRLRVEALSGWFAGDRSTRSSPSELRATLELSDSAWRGFQILVSVEPRGAPPEEAFRMRSSARFHLQGPGRHEIVLRRMERSAPFEILLDGGPLESPEPPPSRPARNPIAGRAELHASLLPAGLGLKAETLRRFPAFVLSRSLDLGP